MKITQAGASRRVRIAIAVAAAAALSVSMVPQASAESYSYMRPTDLEQAVLRAQPGTELGTWTQNFYFTNDARLPSSQLTPVLCPSMSEVPITLPKASSFGAVGYSVSPDISLSITIWQYKSDAVARQALAQFKKASCPDAPRIPWEDEKFYTMDSGGGDYTSSQVKGVPAYLKGYSGKVDGTPISVTWAVRPVGKAIIRVDAQRFNGSATSTSLASKAPALIGTWIDAASRAVLKFSSNDPNAA